MLFKRVSAGQCTCTSCSWNCQTTVQKEARPYSAGCLTCKQPTPSWLPNIDDHLGTIYHTDIHSVEELKQTAADSGSGVVQFWPGY